MQQSVSAEGYKALINKAFDVAEAPVRNWMTYFIEKPASEMFEKDVVKADSLWIHPSSPNGKYIEFKIKMVKNDYKTNLGKDAADKKIQDIMQFLAFSITTVYDNTLKTMNRCKLHDVSMEWNPTKYICSPKYTPEPVRELNKNKNLIQHHLSYKNNVMRTASEEKKKEWYDDYENLMSDQKKYEAKVEEMKDMVEDRNKYLASCKKIGIQMKKYKKNELPRGMFMNNLPKIGAPSYK